MKVEQKVIFEVERNEKIYRFEIPQDAPLVDAYQCAYECMNRILQSIIAANEQLKPKGESDIKDEENVKEEGE